MEKIEVFKEEYDGESLVDVYRDISECFDPKFNPIINEIPCDEHYILKGKFIVTVIWEPED